MKIKTFKQFKKLVETTHKTNLQTMELLVSLDWFQKKVKEARRTAGYPEKGYKIGDKKLLKKTGKNSLSFIPKAKLVSNPEKHTKYKKIVSEIMKKAGLPEHFEFHIDGYILYGWINAPITNFITEVKHNLKTGERKFPTTEWQGMPHGSDIKLAQEHIEDLVKGYPQTKSNTACLAHLIGGSNKYPPLLSRKFKIKRKLSTYIKNNQTARKVKSKKYQDHTGSKVKEVGLTDRDVVYEAYGDKPEREIKRKANLISQQRKRLKMALEERGLDDN